MSNRPRGVRNLENAMKPAVLFVSCLLAACGGAQTSERGAVEHAAAEQSAAEQSAAEQSAAEQSTTPERAASGATLALSRSDVRFDGRPLDGASQRNWFVQQALQQRSESAEAPISVTLHIGEGLFADALLAVIARGAMGGVEAFVLEEPGQAPLRLLLPTLDASSVSETTSVTVTEAAVTLGGDTIEDAAFATRMASTHVALVPSAELSAARLLTVARLLEGQGVRWVFAQPSEG